MARWANCPGSYRLAKLVPPAPTSIHAAAGTVAHELMEEALDDDAGDYAALRAQEGTLILHKDYEVWIDAAMIRGVELMCDYVDRARIGSNYWMVEATVELDWVFANDRPPLEPMFGRADVVIVGSKTIEVVDFKNGRGVLVQAQDNMQLLYYAAGALFLSAPVSALVSALVIERVRLTIVQPNAITRDKIRSVELPVVDLYLWIDDVLIPAVRAVEDPDAPVVPGRWCQFCPAIGICPAMHERALAVAELEFQPFKGDHA